MDEEGGGWRVWGWVGSDGEESDVSRVQMRVSRLVRKDLPYNSSHNR